MDKICHQKSHSVYQNLGFTEWRFWLYRMMIFSNSANRLAKGQLNILYLVQVFKILHHFPCCTEWPDVSGHAYEQGKTWIFQIVKKELVTLLHDHVVLCRCLNDVTSCHMILTTWLDPKWSLYIGYSEWHQWN